MSNSVIEALAAASRLVHAHNDSSLSDGDRTVKAAIPASTGREPLNRLIRASVRIDLADSIIEVRIAFVVSRGINEDHIPLLDDRHVGPGSCPGEELTPSPANARTIWDSKVVPKTSPADSLSSVSVQNEPRGVYGKRCILTLVVSLAGGPRKCLG